MICRLCLTTLNEAISVPIFNGSNSHSNTTLANMITKHLFLELNPDDNISTFICQNCYDYLEDFHIFWCSVEQKQKTLKTSNIEVDKIGLVDTKLKKFGKGYMGNITNLDKVDIIAKKQIDQGLDVDTDSQDNAMMSSDDDIPLVAYKTSPTKRKSKITETILRSNIIKRSCKSKLNSKNEKITKTINPKTSSVLDSLELSCELCKESVGDFDDLISHFSSKHGGKKAFVRCCRRTITEKKKLLSHLHWHRNPEDYRCNVCKKILSSEKYLKLHMTVRHNAENVSSFKRTNNNNENFVCHICSKSFPSSHRLKHHIRVTHDNVYPYRCSACMEPFNFKAEMEKHFDNCKNKCLLTRITTGESLEEKNVNEESICKICHKIFLNKRQLRRHIVSVHENIHPFICDQCGKKFKFKPAFEKHLLEHSGIVDPPAQCNICGNWLKNKQSLRFHLYRHDDANNKCHLCDRVCPSRLALKGHIHNVHRDEKQYKCKYCEKSFKNQKNLEEHTATHTGVQLYSCPHCLKETRSSSNMYVHIKRMHADEWAKSKLARSNNPNLIISQN